MGFSLVGNSGDQTSNLYQTTYTASSNPQQDFQGSGAGAFGVTIAPVLQGSNLTLNPDITDYYAPLNIVSTGDNLGDQALKALQNLTSTQTNASETPGTNSPAPLSLSSLFSGNTLYYILAAIVVLFLAHHKN